MKPYYSKTTGKPDLVHRLLLRATIRENIQTRRSVQRGEPDRLSELLREAATEIQNLQDLLKCK